MNISKLNYCLLILLLNVLLCTSCKKGYMDKIGPFYISNDTTAIMNGDMGSKIDNHFEKLISKFPSIRLIIVEDCPGSRNDEVMFEAAKSMRSHSINTHLPSNGNIQSGAVDFYLAGINRTNSTGSKIGIHAWSDGNTSATDYPSNHSEHQLYINYYKDIGFSQQEAEDLYFFIINAASPEDIYWMTDQEIIDYKITTQ